MKKTITLALTVIFALLSIASFAIAQNTTSPSSDKPHIKSSGGFGAQLWITDDKDYLKKWNQPTGGFYIHTVNLALREQPIFILIIFANPGVNEKGLCNISADITVKTPDGKMYGEIKDGNCWQNLPAVPEGDIQLGNTSMGIVIEKKDPSGRYTVEAVIKDKIKNVELRLEQYFDVK